MNGTAATTITRVKSRAPYTVRRHEQGSSITGQRTWARRGNTSCLAIEGQWPPVQGSARPLPSRGIMHLVPRPRSAARVQRSVVPRSGTRGLQAAAARRDRAQCRAAPADVGALNRGRGAIPVWHSRRGTCSTEAGCVRVKSARTLWPRRGASRVRTTRVRLCIHAAATRSAAWRRDEAEQLSAPAVAQPAPGPFSRVPVHGPGGVRHRVRWRTWRNRAWTGGSRPRRARDCRQVRTRVECVQASLGLGCLALLIALH
jgi:hypothetical protein